MTTRIMLDLETLDTQPTAVVVSIGAVAFDPATGLGKEFYEVLELEEQAEYGRTLNAGTVAWWLQQSEEARKAVYQGKRTGVSLALARFFQFVNDVGGGEATLGFTARPGDKAVQNVEMWAHGADFDCVILGQLYQAYGMTRPWSYSKNRCYRTLMNLAKGLVEVPARMGTHHNALDDAKYQAVCANAYLTRLRAR